MMLRSAGLGLVLAGSACAQNLQLSVRVFDGTNWSDSFLALRGSTVRVGIWMSGDTSIYGMGGATMRLTGTSLVAGDSVRFAEGTSTGRMAPFNFGAATNAIFRDSASTFRIDDSNDVLNINGSAGMTFFQRDPATANPGTFSTANPALCFAFDVTIAAEWAPDRDIVMSLDQLSRGLAAYYTAANASRPATAGATLNSAVIHVWPTPSTGVVLGLAVLGGRRRR